LFNGFYDLNTGTPFTPYIGGGIGVGFFHASLTGNTPAGHAITAYSGSDTTFAYQGIAGVSYALSPNLSLTADYRYLATTDATIKSGGNKWNVENANHILSAGVRWSFGAPQVAEVIPAAVMTPEPAPAPVTQYSLLFDWDKSTITPESHATIAQAAAVANQAHATIILVTGYTDTTGSSQYNQALSERRAAAVKRELIQQGISPDLIQTVGKGKTDLAVPTPDETRDHQNRRAQIILRIG
jgi:outer membrane protein OmpA-like peptidoglycan-associated protein